MIETYCMPTTHAAYNDNRKISNVRLPNGILNNSFLDAGSLFFKF